MIRKLGAVSYRLARRIVISVVGGTVLLGGVIMLLTPGPGIVAILLGLAILAAEFAWAKLWLDKLKDSVGPESRDAARKSYQRIKGRFFKAKPPADP